MVKGSKPRHSRSTRKPVTIDLEPGDVKDEKAAGNPADKPADKPVGRAAKNSSPSSTNKATGPKVGKPASDQKSSKDQPGDQAAETPEANKPAAAKSGTSQAQAKTERPAAEPIADRSSNSGSGLKSFIVGLVAAIVAVAAVIGLQMGGVLPVPGSSSNVLSDDVSALKQTVADLEQKASVDGGEAATALVSRIEALESSTGTSTISDDIEKRIGALESKTTQLSSQAGTQSGSADATALAGVDDKIAAVENSQAALQKSLQEIDAKVSDLGDRIATDESAQDKTISGLEARLAAMEKTLDEPRQDIKVARALAAASLKAAIDRGGSFMAELEAFASVDGTSPALEQLRSLAAAGVPSRSDLLTQFPDVANTMISAADSNTGSGGLFDHLLDSATSLVKVRPVGDVSGDSVEAIVARMETRLNNGDLQGALDEWNTLPQASKDASQAFKKDLEARIEAEKLVSGTLTAALPSSQTTAAPDDKPDSASGTTQTGEQN